MKFNMKKAGPLLAWMNTVFPEKHVWEFVPMRDGILLLKICFRLRGTENTADFKTLSLYEKVEIIFSVLHDDFHLTERQSSLILQKISGGIDLELQLAKVALLLCYCAFKKGILLPMDTNVESEVTSMFGFVKDDADGLSLEEGLDQFLAQDSFMNVVNSSSGSSGSSLLYTDDESPIVGRFQRPPRVQFQELCTVASSSDGSPMQDVMSTPHFQLKRLRKELAHEGDVRDELEKELADQISIISEKEGVISQLQHRVERMLREQGELEKDHKDALLELQEKNESLLHRVHEVLKQCQDLKTDNSQKERKIDELTEENGALTAQVRNVLAQLARAEEEVAKLTLAHESAQTEWKSRKEFLEKELNEAVTHKESLSEQVQILQGKISVLEDELQRAQSQEKGEVLGPIMEWEKLKQELADLTLKLAQLQDTISCLEKEKAEVEALLAEERGSFEKETKRLQMVVFDLEQSINSIRLERETLQEALRTQKEMLTIQISALESDVSRLQQVEVQLTAEIKISADLRQQREELEGKVASLDKMVHALHAEIQGLEVQRASQQDALNALIVDLQSARATVQDYEKKLEEQQKVVQENESLKKKACTLQQGLDEHLQSIGDLQEQINILRQEKTEEENKVSQALTKIKSLQTQILDLSQQISLKDEEIRNLKSEYDNVGHELKLVKEQNIEINEMIKSNRKEHEDTVKKLQQELDSASSIASEKQEEMLVLSVEVTTLKEQICRYSENEVQKQKELSVLEGQHNVLKENMTSIQNQLAEVTATASQKESELHLLQQELRHQETLREKAQELEKARREELERTVSELQATILEVTSLASEREACLSSLQDEMKDQQLRAKQCEDDLRNELMEKIGNLQELLNTANHDAADKDHLLQSLNQKLKQVELLCQQKEKDVTEMHQAKEDLERRIIEQKQQLDECQQNLEMMRNERDHLSTQVSSLQEEICRSQQEMSVLQADYNVLKENLSALQNQLVEVTNTASQKESELLLLQQELSHQATLREKALELEAVKREEFEKKVSELQAKIVEVSTLASQREAQVISLQNEMKDQQSRAKESEDDLRRELEQKVGTLQGELDTVNRCAVDKDKLLGSLDQKLKEMEGLFLQKEKDVLEMHQAKEELEKRIVELHVETQQLSECQQNLEKLSKERDHLSTEVTSLKEEIHGYQDTEVQKEQVISVLEVERNMLKENMAVLEKKLVEETTAASQKHSELVLLQDKLHQQESLREKARELETAKREELEITVNELQAKILEVSTLASEREACVNSLKEQLTDQLKTKQSEDDLRKVLQEKVESLQGQLETASRDVSDKDQLLETLDQKLKQMDLLCQQKEKDVHQVKEDLEKKIGELVVEKQQLVECQQNLETVRKERDSLSTEVTSLKDEIRHFQENEVQKQQEISVLEVEHNTLKDNLVALKMQVAELTTTASQKESEVQLLKKEVCEQENVKERARELEKDVSALQAKILEISTLASEREAQISCLKDEINDQQLRAKQSEDDLRRVLEEKVVILQRQLETTSHDVSDKDQLLQTLDQKLRKMELLCQQKEKDVIEIQHSKEDLEKRIVELDADKRQLDGFQQNMEMLRKERDHLSSLNQSVQRECDASQKIRAELELKVEEQNGSILALKKVSQKWEEQNQELLEQLKTKSEAVEHYKAQVEKAKNHYNSKKQLLVEAQELNKTLEHSLEASKKEVKALEMELKLTRMELDQASNKEKNLATKVKSLEAQVDFADRQLREQKMMMTNDKENMRHRDSLYNRVQEKPQDTSTDSLEFDLNDSLNANSRSSILGESSTPLVRSSERLAAKRRALGAESLETLYFTPMSQQGNKRKGDHKDAFEHKLESSITSIGDLVVDSAKKLTASARRHRTTQAINMAKKTSGSAEGDESFYSLHSARSQPNLAVQHSRPFSMDLSEETAAATLSKADTLQRLPGYRKSTVHNVGLPGATSTFCIGAENEPEHAPDDWMRIAELQSRNKACLPHLKSSYPLESRPSLGPSFTITDEDLRMGDPGETIRRASMMPGQIQESLNNRRFSLAPSSSQSSANSQPQRATMLPGQIRSSTAAHRAAQLTKTSSNLRASENKRSPLAPKRPGSQLQDPDTPEMKKLTSCFPRPMTPKGMFGSSQNRPPKSPADRRQSVMFTVVNTPKNSGRGDSRLQRGLNKLRNSARKSPAAASRALRSTAAGRSPLDSTLRKSPRNKSPKSSNAKKMKIRIKV
uniref:Nuclear mitotic apparatus protein 1 n=1 Tax=Cyprinus carpio carpio TaxID=630221 RepID=A0A9J7XKR9_CYPCA